MDDKLYDVVIVDSKTRKIESLAGRAMTYKRAEKREETALGRISIGPYFVATIPHDEANKEGYILPKDVEIC